jgi:hypothetical protein
MRSGAGVPLPVMLTTAASRSTTPPPRGRSAPSLAISLSEALS